MPLLFRRTQDSGLSTRLSQDFVGSVLLWCIVDAWSVARLRAERPTDCRASRCSGGGVAACDSVSFRQPYRVLTVHMLSTRVGSIER